MERISNATISWVEQRLKPYPAVASVSLNFKQGRQFPFGWVRISREIAEKQISWLLKNLNRTIFRNQTKRLGRKLPTVVVYETGQMGDHFHAHLAIGIPDDILPVKILDAIRDIWAKANWGYGHNDIGLTHCLSAWVRYILYSGPDCLDDKNSHLPESS